MSAMEQIPEKSTYRVNEVCQYTDTQPYVLRFWETEFPQLNPNKSSNGQSIYRKEDIELILRIKKLLYEHDFTIPGARKALEDGYDAEVTPVTPEPDQVPEENSIRGSAGASAQSPISGPRAVPEPPTARIEESAPTDSAGDVISRSRYEDAVDEVEELRLRVQETESKLRKADTRAERAQVDLGDANERKQRAVTALRDLVDRLS